MKVLIFSLSVLMMTSAMARTSQYRGINDYGPCYVELKANQMSIKDDNSESKNIVPDGGFYTNEMRKIWARTTRFKSIEKKSAPLSFSSTTFNFSFNSDYELREVTVNGGHDFYCTNLAYIHYDYRR